MRVGFKSRSLELGVKQLFVLRIANPSLSCLVTSEFRSENVLVTQTQNRVAVKRTTLPLPRFLSKSQCQHFKQTTFFEIYATSSSSLFPFVMLLSSTVSHNSVVFRSDSLWLPQQVIHLIQSQNLMIDISEM